MQVVEYGVSHSCACWIYFLLAHMDWAAGGSGRRKLHRINRDFKCLPGFAVGYHGCSFNGFTFLLHSRQKKMVASFGSMLMATSTRCDVSLIATVVIAAGVKKKVWWP
mmetsp:Transcript_20838/g.34071  ORF Transcript_20838/g.34071 Transcript_20838/m.34071 type:complete len:108 (+) Transcript_20838:1344-1667(+)